MKKVLTLTNKAKTVRRSFSADGPISIKTMYYVYLIKSIAFPELFYVGYTTNLKQRFAQHNSGGSIHTAKYRPWELVMYLGFADERKAKAFEKYLKSQSGRAFAKKRFM